MKYVVILGDGMADYPVDAFDGKTILEVADKPTIDYMEIGRASCRKECRSRWSPYH